MKFGWTLAIAVGDPEDANFVKRIRFLRQVVAGALAGDLGPANGLEARRNRLQCKVLYPQLAPHGIAEHGDRVRVIASPSRRLSTQLFHAAPANSSAGMRSTAVISSHCSREEDRKDTFIAGPETRLN
jgi:hypothetical protein